MSSRDLVPYGNGRDTNRELVPYRNGRGTTRDIVPYESGPISIRPPRESTRDSRPHQTTARSQTSHRDYYPYGSERDSSRPRREPTRDSSQTTVRGQTSLRDHYTLGSERESPRPRRESTRDSSQTVRGVTSHRDHNPYGSERVSTRPGRESIRDSRLRQTTTTSAYTPPQGHSTPRTSARRDCRTNTNYSIPEGVAERLWQLDEAHYSNDGKTITHRARYSNLVHNSTTEFEVRETPTSCTRIRRITHRSDENHDGYSDDDIDRDHNIHRTGSTRYPTATGSSRHHTNTGNNRRETLTSSRDTHHRTAGGYRSTYDESSRSTRR